MVINTMITPPHEWKPMISPKPNNESNHYRLTRTSVLPNLACMDFYKKVQDSGFPDDKIRRKSDEIRDLKYKFKTGDLIRIPLSNIMTGPVENEALRIVDNNLNYCKWAYAEPGTILNEDESLVLTKSAKMSRYMSNNKSQNGAMQYRTCGSTMTLPKSSVFTISSQVNHDRYGGILRENIYNLRGDNTENQFRNIGMKQSSEISKTKFQETKRTPFKAPFSSLTCNVKIENDFKYKVNASELPRSQTPLSEKDPDKINFKNVASFLSDDRRCSSGSINNKNQADLSTGEIETANATNGSDTPIEKFFDPSCRNQNGSSLKLPDNTDAMNLVRADIFTSPSRSAHSSGAFKTSFRLRRAPKHREKPKKENDTLGAHPKNESKYRLKLQKFLDFAVSTRDKSAHKDSLTTSATPSKEFLQVPSQHIDFGKQLLVAGNDTRFENNQETNNRCQTEMRESDSAKTVSEKDFQSLTVISTSRQCTFPHSDKRNHCKKNYVQKSHSDIGDSLVKDQTCSVHEKGRKNTDNNSSKSGHSVVIIPACTPVNDSSDSEFMPDCADQSTADIRSLRSLNSAANLSCERAAPLNSGSSFASSTNMSTLSVFSKHRQETSHRNRNQNRKQAAVDEQEQIITSKLKNYSPVKLTFRKERIISLQNAEFLSKFLKSEKNQQTKSINSEYD